MKIFPKDKEDSIQQINKLGQDVQVRNEYFVLEFCIVSVGINLNALPSLVSKVGRFRGEVEKVSIDDNHEDVVGKNNGFNFERFPILHHLGPQHLYKVNVTCNDGKNVPWTTRHERVMSDPGITDIVPKVIVVIINLFERFVRKQVDTWSILNHGKDTNDHFFFLKFDSMSR